MQLRLRVVSNFGDGDCGAGKIHTRARAKFRGDATSRRVSSKFRARARVYFARPTIAIAKIRDYLQLRAVCSVMHQSIPAAPIPPPGNCGAFACLVSPGGGALAKLARPGGRAFAYPRAFDTHVVSDSKSIHEGFYRKGPAVRRGLDRLPRTRQTCGGFLDFMHFFIAYQGTTIT